MDAWETLRHLGAPPKTAAVDTDDTLGGLYREVDAVLASLADIAGRMHPTLVAARSKSSGLPEGKVWQSLVIKLLNEASYLLEEVDTLKYRLEDAEVSSQKEKMVGQSASALFVPRKATVAYAISDLDFVDDKIVYSTDVLKAWGVALADWAKTTRANVAKIGRRLQA